MSGISTIEHCRLENIQVTPSEPYKSDLLDRVIDGRYFSDLVKAFSQGFVMALNGKWGSGKTTFVKMWQQQMKNEGYETIYYNAWDNDSMPDPLVSLFAEFNILSSSLEKKRKKLLKNKLVIGLCKILFEAPPDLLEALASAYLVPSLGAFLAKPIRAMSKKGFSMLSKYIDNYSTKEETITAFRESLTEYVKKVSPEKPILYIIDDLDRCRPDFAVKTLERIKHLFNVNNVVFVIAVDQKQLGNSIRGYYGSDLIDADDYLRRFFDVQFNLPKYRTPGLIDSIFERFDLSSVPFEDEEKEKNIINSFKNFIEMMYMSKDLSIRQLEKWIIHTRLVLYLSSQRQISRETVAFLVYLLFFDPDVYNQLKSNDFNNQSLFSLLAHYFPKYSNDIEDYMKDGVIRAHIVIVEILKMRLDNNTFKEMIVESNGQTLLELDNSNVDEKALHFAIEYVKNRDIPSYRILNILLGDMVTSLY